MNTSFECDAVVTQGSDGRLRIQLIDEPSYRRFVNGLAVGECVEIRMASAHMSASDKQRRWWWSFVAKLADHVGYDRHERDSLHYALLALCFKYDHSGPMHLMKKPSWTHLTMQEASHLMEWSTRFARDEFGLDVALPSELLLEAEVASREENQAFPQRVEFTPLGAAEGAQSSQPSISQETA